MKQQLTHISPLRAGIVLAVLYGILSLLFAPIILLAGLFANKSNPEFSSIFSVGFAVMLPIIYAVFGFVGGVIASALYNLVAKWTGGLEFELGSAAPAVTV